jgi:flavodoxin
MKTGIFYFSKDGSSQIAAEILGKKLNASVIEIKETKKRHGFMSSGFRAVRKTSGKLVGSPQERVAEFDRIILGTPIWAGNGTPAINGFIDLVDLSGKEVLLFTVQADPKCASSPKVHDYLADRMRQKGARVPITCYALHGSSPGKTASMEYIQEQIDKLNLS